MGLEKLIQVIAILATLAASTGKLPQLILQIRMAQARLIQETKASNWGVPMLLKNAS